MNANFMTLRRLGIFLFSLLVDLECLKPFFLLLLSKNIYCLKDFIRQ